MGEEGINVNYIYNMGGIKYTVSKKSDGPSEFLNMSRGIISLMHYLLKNKNQIKENKIEFSNNFPRNEKNLISEILKASKE